MRSSSFKSGSGRIVVALLGLFFLKALGDGYGGGNAPRGRAAEGMEFTPPVPVDLTPSTPPTDKPVRAPDRNDSSKNTPPCQP